MVEQLKYSSVSIDEVIDSKLRLEANVFNVEARKAKEILKNCKWDIRKVCGKNGIAIAFHRGRFKRIFVEKSKFPIYQPSQILELYPKPYKYISELTQTDIDALRVKKGQILMSCSGSIGKCTIVSKTFDNQIFSHDLIRISTKVKEDTGYLYTFLLSDVGQNIIKTNNYGAVIQHIEPEHLENVEIPNPPKALKEKIHNLIIESFDLRDQSNVLLDKAEKLLIDALHMPPIEEIKPDYFDKTDEIKTFNVGLNVLNNRFDASYHTPIVLKIIDYFLDNAESITLLGNNKLTSRMFIPGRFKRVYLENNESGVPLFSGKCIYELDPSNKKYISRLIHKDRIGKDLTIIENMILITCSGTTGKSCLVPKHWNNWVMTHDIVRIEPGSTDSVGYLSVFLGSEYGQLLLQRANYGAVVPHLEVDHVAATPVPILKDKSLMKEINDLALHANRLRTEAYYKEQEALKVMNDEVIYVSK